MPRSGAFDVGEADSLMDWRRIVVRETTGGNARGGKVAEKQGGREGETRGAKEAEGAERQEAAEAREAEEGARIGFVLERFSFAIKIS